MQGLGGARRAAGGGDVSDVTVFSLRSSANCGYSAIARMSRTSGTSTSPSRSVISRDSTRGPVRLCTAPMYRRSA